MQRPVGFLYLSVCAAIPCLGCVADDPSPIDSTAAAEAGDDQVVARIEVPTADGRDHYAFTFVAAEDGVLATYVASPLGYPAPIIPDECALDTFLRVAPDDAIVPFELRQVCLGPSAGDPDARRAIDLRPPGLTLELQPTAAALTGGPVCNIDDFNTRYTQLQKDAAYVPKIPQCHPICLSNHAEWDAESCTWYSPDDIPLYACSDLDWQGFQLQGGPEGQYCPSPSEECVQVPDPACSHVVGSNADWGPFLDWERFNVGAVTTRFRVEISACDAQSTTAGFWTMRTKTSEAWSGSHPFVFAGAALHVVNLSAGFDSHGRWLGVDFLVHANGNGLHILSASVQMKGKDKDECPINL